MQLTVLFALAAAAATNFASAHKLGYAVVDNICTFPAYVQSYPYSGGNGSLVKLAPGGSYSERFNPAGSTIKMGTTAALAKPLFFGYSITSSPSLAYYELSAQYGNPFASYPNSMTAARGCYAFECSANNASCYSTPGAKKVESCPRPLNISTTLCGLMVV